MNPKYANTQIMKQSFSFLGDLGFEISREENLNYGSYLEFIGNGLKIYLAFEFKSYTFSFDIYKGENSKYSDSAYGNDIISFCSLAKKYNSTYDCETLQPDNSGYKNALMNNVNVLRKYIDRVLLGEIWF
ncbi:MAG: hypothetical protein ED557_11960 [Balneola sp.]|nr:MAG: hypothetical protein ED557_11960 [Balneola sp.]